MNLKSLSHLLPGFMRKPGAPPSQPAPALAVAAPKAQPPAVHQPEPTRPQKMLDDICAFLARYLQCSHHQRTVLSLWILHTHCFAAARTTPYLAIQSARKLSGKTLCLRLLSLLSSHPTLTSGYTAATLVQRIHSNPHQLPTFLLDESPATLGSHARSRNPKLRSILVSGFQPGIAYSDRSLDCTIFSPKAFASLGPLPEPLADCSIPILLQPLHHPEQSNIQRFDLATAQQKAQPLVAALQSWSRKNIAALQSAPACQRKDFPQRLTWRGQDLVEPLLHLADLVGGDYPARAREALLHIFDDPGRQQSATDVQLLRQIRLCFEHHRWPDGLPTSLILADLHSLPSRPWDIDGPLTDRSLARMLRRYDIHPRVFRKKSSSSASSTARGYLQEDFVTVWHNLLDPPVQHPKANNQKPISLNNDAACYAVTDTRTSPEISINRREPVPAAAAGRNLSPVPSGLSPDVPVTDTRTSPEISINRREPVPAAAAGRNLSPVAGGLLPDVPVTDARTSPEISPNRREPVPAAAAGRNLSPVPSGLLPDVPVTDTRTSPEISAHRREPVPAAAAGRNLSPVPSGLLPDVPVTDARTSPEISPNRREPVPAAAAGRNLSPVPSGLSPDVPVDPRIKGILDNPLNFYRQYPDEHKAELRRLIAEPYHWPQPSDDTMPPDVIFTMPDGARIPFTVVNRPPRKPPLCLPDRHTERWPVLLNDKERLQVAVARFYELHALDVARKVEALSRRDPEPVEGESLLPKSCLPRLAVGAESKDPVDAAEAYESRTHQTQRR